MEERYTHVGELHNEKELYREGGNINTNGPVIHEEEIHTGGMEEGGRNCIRREDRHENSYLLAGSDKLPKDRFFVSAQLDSFSLRIFYQIWATYCGGLISKV